MLPLFPLRIPQAVARHRILAATALLTLLLALAPSAQAWTPGLKEAAEAVARGGASAQQRMLVFVNNQEVNLMGLKGTIPQDVYATCQSQFESLNTKFATQAVEEAGFQTDFKQRSAQAKVNPGTDTDVNFRAPAGKQIGLDDLKKIETNYQRIARQHFSDQQLSVPEGRLNTDTDFLPDPGQMSPQEFKKCAEHINSGGGTAYKSPEAVKVQMKLDGKSTAPVELEEAISFIGEGKELARHKLSDAKTLRRDAAAIRKANPGLAERLEAQAQLCESQAAKYVSRIDEVNAKLRTNHDLPQQAKDASGLDLSRDNIKQLNRGTQTASDAAAMNALDEQLLHKATDQTIDTLAEIAKADPMKANQARKAIAAELNSLPPSKVGEALQRLEKTVGPNFTKSISNESRRLAEIAKSTSRAVDDVAALSPVDKVVDKFAKTGVKALKVGVIAGGAYFMGKDGVYHALEQTEATDTDFDFVYKVYKNAAWYGTGIGYAYEEAEKEEIARYMREVEAGRDPGMTKHVIFTILKTPFLMGRDITEGILYAPDALLEAITGAKEAEAKDRAAKEFLAAVRLAVLNKKETEQAKDLAKEMGVRPEDEKGFLDCMCRACGGSLGGSFNPACTSDIGHGPCQCNGPLTIWKTPLPMGESELQYKCFNTITRMHYNQAQATFDKWRQRMREENYNSVKKDIDLIRQQMEKGEFLEAANRFKAIRPLIEDTMSASGADGSSHNLTYDLGTRITNGLMDQAKTHAADPALPSPLSQAVRKADKAVELNPNQGFIRQQADTYKAWEKAWNETLSKDVPEIRRLLEKGYLKSGGDRFSLVQSGINQGRLPPRHRDPQIVALEELLRQKRQPGAYTVSLSKPSAASPRPKTWQCRAANDCGMVAVGADIFVSEETITLRADIAPRAEGMAYIWSVTPSPNSTLHCQTEPREQTMTMRCPGISYYQVFVSAQSGDGTVLGHASQQVRVGIDAAEVSRAEQEKKAYEAARQSGTAKLQLSNPSVAAQTPINLQWSAQGNIADTAWISLVPGDTPRGDINRNDSSALVSRRIGQERSGTMAFTAPDKPGRYELRFNDPTSKRELASVALIVQEAKRADPASAAPIAATTANLPPAKPAPATAPSTTASTTPYGSILPLAGVWQVNFHNWTGTLNIGTDGSAVLRLTSKEEVLTNLGYKSTGEVTFTRLLSGNKHRQVYTGLVSGNTAKGTFDCTSSGKGQPWNMTRSGDMSTVKAATLSAQNTESASKAVASALPSGWQPITLGYLQFALPGGWKHKTESETWVEKLHIYWQGNFDSPENGLTCGVVTNYNKAKAEMAGGSNTTVAGISVYRNSDGDSDTLLFPAKSGTQGVILMFYSGSKSASVKEGILKTIQVK